MDEMHKSAARMHPTVACLGGGAVRQAGSWNVTGRVREAINVTSLDVAQDKAAGARTVVLSCANHRPELTTNPWWRWLVCLVQSQCCKATWAWA